MCNIYHRLKLHTQQRICEKQTFSKQHFFCNRVHSREDAVARTTSFLRALLLFKHDVGCGFLGCGQITHKCKISVYKHEIQTNISYTGCRYTSSIKFLLSTWLIRQVELISAKRGSSVILTAHEMVRCVCILSPVWGVYSLSSLMLCWSFCPFSSLCAYMCFCIRQ